MGIFSASKTGLYIHAFKSLLRTDPYLQNKLGGIRSKKDNLIYTACGFPQKGFLSQTRKKYKQLMFLSNSLVYNMLSLALHLQYSCIDTFVLHICYSTPAFAL